MYVSFVEILGECFFIILQVFQEKMSNVNMPHSYEL